MRARHVFITGLLIAAPGLLWQAFEMYGLTLGGAQMLFFSIAHTMPLVLILVVLALPAGLLVLVQVTSACVSSDGRVRLGISKLAARVLAGFLLAHFVSLSAYDEWSSSGLLRVPICIAGILLTATTGILTAVSLGNPQSAHRE